MEVSWTDPRHAILLALAALALLAWLPPAQPPAWLPPAELPGAGDTDAETLAAVWGVP
jgi:hypothetical protein